MPIDSFARDLAAAALQKQGGGGGGTGTGDMEKKVYDPTGAVETDGGIENYVAATAKPLTVNLTATTGGKYTADKTYTQIKAAYDKHVPIQVRIAGGGKDATLPLMNAEINDLGAGFTFGYTQLQNDAQTASMRSIHYLHMGNADEWEDNDQSAEYLNVNTGGTVLGPINMGANAITNVQEVHIDGTAPLYLGSTVKPAGTDGVRVTGTTNGEAAVVAPDSQSTFRPINVGEPTAQSHAVPKSTLDASLSKYLPLSGGTVQGNFTVASAPGDDVLFLDSSSGTYIGLGNYSGKENANITGGRLSGTRSEFGLKLTRAADNNTLVTFSHAPGVKDTDSATVGQMNAGLAGRMPVYNKYTQTIVAADINENCYTLGIFSDGPIGQFGIQDGQGIVLTLIYSGGWRRQFFYTAHRLDIPVCYRESGSIEISYGPWHRFATNLDINNQAVRYDAAQSLTDAQKTVARTNIGAEPPEMQLGVEYRTTERYLGKPVYVKLVNCGAGPTAGGEKVVSHGATPGYIVDFGGLATYNTTVFGLPVTFSTQSYVSMRVDQTDISLISTGLDISIYLCMAWFKYTKQGE